MCTSCNNKIGKSEQQFLSCGPESFFRDLVKPKIPKRRQRGHSQVSAMGAKSPQSKNDCGDHWESVRRSKDSPKTVFPEDQIVIHDNQGSEYSIKLFSGMRPEHLNDQIKKLGVSKIEKGWLHCDTKHSSEFQQLTKDTWPKFKMQSLPDTEAGTTLDKGRTTFTVNEHYFRAVAKIAFHYYLAHSRRGFRGDEQCFTPMRDFIMNGGNHDAFFNQPGPKFAMPFGDIPSGGVIPPKQWCHVIAADETDKVAVVYIQLFVGPGRVPKPYNIKLADINSIIVVSNSTWGHVYLYDESPISDNYAGRVE